MQRVLNDVLILDTSPCILYNLSEACQHPRLFNSHTTFAAMFGIIADLIA